MGNTDIFSKGDAPMALSIARINSIKPENKTKRFFDEKGLYLQVSPNGGKWWRLKYYFGGKEKRLALGVYPDVSLKDARLKRNECRTLLTKGVDPGQEKKNRRSEQKDNAKNNFEAMAREWHTRNLTKWSPRYAKYTMRRLERDIFPIFGKKPVTEIRAQEVLEALRTIEARGARETAHRMLGVCSQIFDYVKISGIMEYNPASGLGKGLAPAIKTHFAAVTEPDKAGRLLRMLDGYEGSFTVRQALRLAPLVFVRPGELIAAKWEDIDFDNKEWRYLVSKTKTPHIVPLSTQAEAILGETHKVTGGEPYVFPCARTKGRAMSNMAMLAAMRRIGITKEEMTPHGFRAMARTMLDEILGFRVDFIEQQLAHTVKDPLGRAYNRTKHLPERKEMMQRWADYLDELKGEKGDSGNV